MIDCLKYSETKVPLEVLIIMPITKTFVRKYNLIYYIPILDFRFDWSQEFS